MASTEQRFKYNGKELDENTQWHDYGARHYDAVMGRFFTHDRYAEKYMDYNPYHYVMNNPINAIDINGDSTIWIGFINTLNSKSEDLKKSFLDRVYDPSLLIDDAASISQNIMQTLGDMTGITNATGNENKTAKSLEAGFNTLKDIPNMSDEEKGALIAAGVLVTTQIILEKKLPIKTSDFGPKIASNVPTDGVPKDWSIEVIDEAIDNYKISIQSRKNELDYYMSIGGGSKRQLEGHAHRITLEENFLKSLEKARSSRK